MRPEPANLDLGRRHSPDRESEGGQEEEDIEDRPDVGTVKPEDYPAEERRPL